MRRFVQAGSLAFSLLLFSSTSLAMINANLFLGSNKLKNFDDYSQDFSGRQTGLSLHLDPIPLVPVSFGLFGDMTTFNVESAAEPLEYQAVSLKGYNLGFEVKAWMPFFAVRPYTRLGVVGSSYKLAASGALVIHSQEGDGVLANLNTSTTYFGYGPRVAFGVEYKVPLVALFAEYQVQSLKLQTNAEMVEIRGSMQGVAARKNRAKQRATSNALVLGVSVGI